MPDAPALFWLRSIAMAHLAWTSPVPTCCPRPKRICARSWRPCPTRWSSSTRAAHPLVQRRRREDVRLCRSGSDRREREDADALARPRAARPVSRQLSDDRQAQDHRHRPGHDRRCTATAAPSRSSLSVGEAWIGERPDLYRLHPRPHRAAADLASAPGPPVRARPCRARQRDGHARLFARARAQPAADGRRELLRERRATCSTTNPTPRRCDGPRGARRSGAAGGPRRPDRPSPARLHEPRRDGAAESRACSA